MGKASAAEMMKDTMIMATARPSRHLCLFCILVKFLETPNFLILLWCVARSVSFRTLIVLFRPSFLLRQIFPETGVRRTNDGREREDESREKVLVARVIAKGEETRREIVASLFDTFLAVEMRIFTKHTCNRISHFCTITLLARLQVNFIRNRKDINHNIFAKSVHNLSSNVRKRTHSFVGTNKIEYVKLSS